MVVLIVVRAVVRVANVIVVGVLYLIVYWLVGNGICSSIGEDGEGVGFGGGGVFWILVVMVALWWW